MKSTGLILTVTAVALAVSSPVRASTPQWYPPACATIDYCALVTEVAWSVSAEGAPRLSVMSSHGSAVVHKNFAVQKSEDTRIHVCMRYDPFGTLEVTCLFVPMPGL